MIVAASWAILTAAATAQGQDKYAALEASLADSIRQKMGDMDVPGLAIGLVDGQNVVWASGFGFANLATKTPVTKDTIFSVQSISKTYTATAFMRAVDRKRISLDDHLVKIIPDFKVHDRFGGAQAKRITMRQLLSHWAGLCAEAPVGNNYGEWHCSFAQHVKSINDTWLRSPVGGRYRYSNLGIDLAGYALALKLHKPFEDVMQTELLQPLEMHSSSFRQADVAQSPNLATGYLDAKTPVPPLEIPMVAAGGLYSTVDDMTKYVRFQLAGGRWGAKQWLSPSAVKTMMTPQFNNGNTVRGYGIGMQSRPYHGGRLCSHGGGGYGFGTIQSWMPDYQIGVIILTNGDQGGDLAEDLADQALTGMIRIKKGVLPNDGPYVDDQRPAVAVDAASLTKLAGTYKATSGVAEFKVEDEKLHFHRQRQDVALVPRSPTEFTDAALTQSYHFDLDGNGRPVGVLQQGNVGPDYMALNDQPGESKGPDGPDWQAMTGNFASTAYGQEVDQTVTLKNGYLYWANLKLFPYRGHLFFTADGEAVEFQGQDSLTFGNRQFKRKH